MNRMLLNYAIALVVLSASWPVVAITVVSLQQGVNGYTGGQDTGLLTDSTPGPMSLDEANFGAVDPLPLGSSVSFAAVARNLFRFDLSPLQPMIAAGDTVRGASLTLRVVEQIGAAATINLLFRVSHANRSWLEGDSDGGFAPGTATWAERAALAEPWAGSPGLSSPGIDYVATPLATTASPNGPGFMTFAFSDATFFDDWILHPENNAGFLLFKQDPSLALDYIATGGALLSSDRPKLTLEILPIPEPSTYVLMLAGLGLVGFMARRRKN